MKFQCDHCKTRYSIADEKVRGKILKIRCKTCEAVITVRDGDGDPLSKLVPEPATRPRVSTAGGKGKARPAAKTIEIPQVTESMASPLPPAPPPSFSAPPVKPVTIDEGEWFLSVDGEQDGPLSVDEAQRRVSRKAAGVEMFAWRDDFTDWLPVEEVPILAVHLQKRLPPPPPRRHSGPVGVGTGSATSLSSPSVRGAASPAQSAPQRAASAGGLRVSSSLPALGRNGSQAMRAVQPGAAGTPEPTPEPAPDPTLLTDPFETAGLFESNAAARHADSSVSSGASRDAEETPRPPADFDFHIGEASRVVKLPILAPALAASLRSPSDNLPGVSSVPAAPPTIQATTPARAGESQLPIIDASSRVAAQSSSTSTDAKPVRRRRLLVPLALGGVVITALLGAVVLLSRGGDEHTHTGGEGDGDTDNFLVNNFYRKENPLLNEAAHSDPAGVGLPQVPSAALVPGPATAAGKAPVKSQPGASAPRRADVAAGTPSASTPPGRLDPPRIGPAPVKPGGKQDTFDDEGGSEPLTPDDVRNAYAANEVGLKRCYERALKSDPTTSIPKMVVKITIAPRGNISDINVPDKGDLSTCVSASIRSWRFRRSNGEFTTEFTVFFAKRG